jgi:hypothetical protein
MGLKKDEIEGATFVEILLALGICCLTGSGILSMLAVADYQSAKCRIESLLGGRLRQRQERLIGMPYATLVGRIPGDRGSTAFTEEGYFLDEPSPQYPWKLDVSLERFHRDSPSEFTTIGMAFTWQEPAPGFPRAKNIVRTLVCPPLQRNRF